LEYSDCSTVSRLTSLGLVAQRGGADRPALFVVEDGAGDDLADVTVTGPPTAELRWVRNREGAGEPRGVTVEGAPEASRSCAAALSPRRSEAGQPAAGDATAVCASAWAL